MTAVDHAIHAGIVVASVADAGGAPPELSLVLFVLAGARGAWPDIAGIWPALRNLNDPRVAWWNVFFGIKVPMRTDVYDRWHHEAAPDPLIALHQWVDLPFHRKPGPWFRRLWLLVIPIWFLEIWYLILRFDLLDFVIRFLMFRWL